MAPDSYRVLVVDNDPVFTEFAAVFFRARNQPFVTAQNGLEALRLLDSEPVDVVVTDLVMPNIDGATLCRIIRSSDQWSNVRVVLVSATAREAFDDLLSVGADLYIAKGPLVQMGNHLSRALELLSSGKEPEHPVLGIDAVHARRITKELLWENRLLHSVLEGMADGVVFLSPDRAIVSINAVAANLLGDSSERLIGSDIGQKLPQFTSLADVPDVVSVGDRLVEIQGRRIDGEDRSIICLILRDITEKHRAKMQLEEALEDRELLLREIHHRIKNNLLSVTSYISLLKSSRGEQSKQWALENVEAHVDAIARVHERLYSSATLSSLAAPSFVRDIVGDLVDLFSAGREIRTEFRLEDLDIPLAVSVPLGLILAELVTNALRHASTASGLQLEISLVRLSENKARLVVRDDGPGIAPDALVREGRSLGLTLIDGLVRQIRGDFSIEADGGTVATVDIPVSQEQAADRS